MGCIGDNENKLPGQIKKIQINQWGSQVSHYIWTFTLILYKKSLKLCNVTRDKFDFKSLSDKNVYLWGIVSFQILIKQRIAIWIHHYSIIVK